MTSWYDSPRSSHPVSSDSPLMQITGLPACLSLEARCLEVTQDCLWEPRAGRVPPSQSAEPEFPSGNAKMMLFTLWTATSSSSVYTWRDIRRDVGDARDVPRGLGHRSRGRELPRTCENFLKLCKIKYYALNAFFNGEPCLRAVGTALTRRSQQGLHCSDRRPVGDRNRRRVARVVRARHQSCPR